MDIFSTFHLERWIEENKDLFSPPFKTNRLLVHHKDFLVMLLRGPNARFDFHIDPGDEFFYQVDGDMELHLKPEGAQREVVHIREGEIFLCPGGLPHSPRRPENTWGLVIERKRRPDETEGFVWFCEKCDAEVLSHIVAQGDVGIQVAKIYEEFNSNPKLRTCAHCKYVFPTTPMAERLTFLQPK